MTTTVLPPISGILETPLAASRIHRPLNVVIVDEELPYPPTSGKRIRTLNLTLRLAHRHHITYICHRNSDPVEARQATDFFTDQGIAVRTVDWSPPSKSGPALLRSPRRQLAVAAALFGGFARQPAAAAGAARTRRVASGRSVALRMDALRPGGARPAERPAAGGRA